MLHLQLGNRDEFWCLAHFLLFYSVHNSSLGDSVTTFGWVVLSQPSLELSSQRCSELCFLGDYRSYRQSVLTITLNLNAMSFLIAISLIFFSAIFFNLLAFDLRVVTIIELHMDKRMKKYKNSLFLPTETEH